MTELKRFGLLLESDPRLPSVCSIVAREPMRGSWWSHPKAQEIFQVNERLEDHDDVLITKLISGKVTFVHRQLGPELFTVGTSRDEWQLKGLSPAAGELLRMVMKKGSLRTDTLPWSHRTKPGDAARELERVLLIVAGQVHTETGAHAKVLETWEHWRQRVKLDQRKTSVKQAKAELEDRLARLNAEFHAKVTMPWQ